MKGRITGIISGKCVAEIIIIAFQWAAQMPPTLVTVTFFLGFMVGVTAIDATGTVAVFFARVIIFLDDVFFIEIFSNVILTRCGGYFLGTRVLDQGGNVGMRGRMVVIRKWEVVAQLFQTKI